MVEVHTRGQETYTTFKHQPLKKNPMVTIHLTRFKIQQFYVLPIQCIYVFSVDLRKITVIFT